MKRPVREITSSKAHAKKRTKKQIFSLEEYNSLRNETVERISNHEQSSIQRFWTPADNMGCWLYLAWHTCFVSDIR